MNSYKEVYDENKIIAQLMKSLEEKDVKIAMLKSELLSVYEREEKLTNDLINQSEAEISLSGQLYVFDRHFGNPTRSLATSITLVHPTSNVKEISKLSKIVKGFIFNPNKSKAASKAKKAKRLGRIRVTNA